MTAAGSPHVPSPRTGLCPWIPPNCPFPSPQPIEWYVPPHPRSSSSDSKDMVMFQRTNAVSSKMNGRAVVASRSFLGPEPWTSR